MAGEDVRQFNVYLPTDLIKRLKHHAVDSGQSLSAMVTDAVGAYLDDAEHEHETRRDDDNGN